MTDNLDSVLAAIDAANEHDPDRVETPDGPAPASLIYGRRMTAELDRLFPDASDVLRIAARGQHIERWMLRRVAYPEGKAGYLTWRRDQAARHATRLAEIMAAAGYPEADRARAGTLVRKEGIKRDAEVQRLEDVICFVFLRWYLADFAQTKDPDHMQRIVEKTARKMSDDGRSRAMAEFDMPPSWAAAFAA